MDRRTFMLAAAIAAVVVSAPLQAQVQAPARAGLSPNELADRIQGFYDKTKTFKAEFKQRYFVKAHAKVIKSSGAVIFQKPGKMSWRYSNNGNRVVSDGKRVKVYERENKQMYEQAMGKSYYPAALSFLLGGGNLRQTFRLQKLDAAQLKFEGGYVLLGEPKAATAAYQKLLLYVDGQTYQVRRVLLLDAQGNRNRFDFLKPQVNLKVPPAEFQFTPPAGTQIIHP